jgi:hypothetical protein
VKSARFLPRTLVVTAFVVLNAFSADASPVSITGGFIGYDGIVQCSTGSYLNGVNITPSGCSGFPVVSYDFATTSSIDFYTLASDANLLQFTPAVAQEVGGVGEEFLLGTFTYTNGTWAFPPPPVDSITVSFNLVLTTVSADSALDGHTLSDSLTLFITRNLTTNTPTQNADFYYFTSFTQLGSVRAYERFDSPSNNTVTVDLYGKIGSLTPTRFDNVQGGGFLDPGIAATPVPEPASLTLLALGLGGAYVHRRKR